MPTILQFSKWVVNDAVLLQHNADKVLPLRFRYPYRRNIFPCTVGRNAFVDYAVEKSENRCTFVDLTMNQYSSRTGLPQYIAEQVKIFRGGFFEVDRDV